MTILENRTVTGRKATYLRMGAVLILGVALAGCSVGRPGYDEFLSGDYDNAHKSFVSDYQNYPDSPVAQINMAISYRHRGEQAKANGLFHDAALSGKDYRPDGMSEPHDSTTTIAEVACRYLADDRQSDPNCATAVR